MNIILASVNIFQYYLVRLHNADNFILLGPKVKLYQILNIYYLMEKVDDLKKIEMILNACKMHQSFYFFLETNSKSFVQNFLKSFTKSWGNLSTTKTYDVISWWGWRRLPNLSKQDILKKEWSSPTDKIY